MATANGAPKANDLHASGQPDTPVEVITALLQSALATENVADVKKQLQKAYDVVAGLDPYLEAVSTPPSTVGRVSVINCLCSLIHECCCEIEHRLAGLSRFDSAVHEARLGSGL